MSWKKIILSYDYDESNEGNFWIVMFELSFKACTREVEMQSIL